MDDPDLEIDVQLSIGKAGGSLSNLPSKVLISSFFFFLLLLLLLPLLLFLMCSLLGSKVHLQ